MSDIDGPETALYRFLDANGDGTGSKDMSVDGSTTPVKFRSTPQGSEVWHIERALIRVADNTAALEPQDFGAISGSLTNGCQFCIERDGVAILDFMDGLYIKNNSDWSRLAHDNGDPFPGAGTISALSCRFSFFKAGQPMLIRASLKDSIVMIIRDDLSSLLDFSVQIQGKILES